jgi:hypothetical protein
MVQTGLPDLTRRPARTIKQPMLRVVLAIGLALHVGISVAEMPTFEGAICTERCPDDDAQGKCAPDCADCVCCPHLGAVALTSAVKVSIRFGPPIVPQHHASPPRSPEPSEISHVPILLA